ncbi:MAG: hypothetical protein M3P45_11735 [Acidobacteriota bacterium]|nr:hypothetical protein [Acidobacteriota bacterium]
MPELKSRDALKPFCPVHHWRMAHDSSTGKAGNSAESFYRCSFESCTMRFSLAAGYHDSSHPAGDHASLSHLETVTCQKNREHHPCIVSYAKESQGSQTEEWRQWRCFSDNCSFSMTQKLSQEESRSLQSAGFALKSMPAAQHQHAFSRR